MYRKTIKYSSSKIRITKPTFRSYCFNQFNDSLPKHKNFFSYRALSLLSITSHASHIFQDGGMSAWVVPISCQVTQSYAPMAKTHGSFVKISSSDVSYHVSYHGTCIEICIVSLEHVSLQP